MKNKLFDDFKSSTKEEWIAQAVRDLKGKSFEEILVKKTIEGIEIQPFYTSEDLLEKSRINDYYHKVNPLPLLPGISPRVWSNAVRIDHGNEKVRNSIILDSLQNGADAIVLELNGKEDLLGLLDQVKPEYIQIFLVPIADPILVFENFTKWLKSINCNSSDVFGGVLWDGSVHHLAGGVSREEVIHISKNLLSFGKDYPNFKAISLSSSHYHNAGSSIIQELAFSLSYLIDLIDDLSFEAISEKDVFDNLLLHTAIGSDYFMEMAKMRAVRIMIQKLAGLYRIDIQPEDVFIYAQTSYWTKSGIDVQTNLLRNTTEAMSAILGGCNAVEVLRHDVVCNEMSEFSLRMSRNVSSILKEESYLDQVLDPVAGTYFIETLIADIFGKVKEKMTGIEQLGGWWKASHRMLIQNEVKSVREEKQRMILEERVTKVGVNKYMSDESESLRSRDFDVNETEGQLKVSRQSLLKEVLNHQKL